jgi:hypothetical protein
MKDTDKPLVVSETTHQGLTLIKFITRETYRDIVARLVAAELERIGAEKSGAITDGIGDSVPVFTLYFERQQKGV